MTRPDPTTAGRCAQDTAQDAQDAHAVAGVAFPGDVGLWIRDDTLGQEAVPPARAGWRHRDAPVAVTLYPTGPDGGRHHYLAEIGRYSAEDERYGFDGLLANGPLKRIAPVVREALQESAGSDAVAAALSDVRKRHR